MEYVDLFAIPHWKHKKRTYYTFALTQGNWELKHWTWLMPISPIRHSRWAADSWPYLLLARMHTYTYMHMHKNFSNFQFSITNQQQYCRKRKCEPVTKRSRQKSQKIYWSLNWNSHWHNWNACTHTFWLIASWIARRRSGNSETVAIHSLVSTLIIETYKIECPAWDGHRLRNVFLSAFAVALLW